MGLSPHLEELLSRLQLERNHKNFYFYLDPTVRDSASEAVGTLLKLMGDKAVGPFLVELEKDALKMSKIREFCEKAVIVVRVPAAKKDRPVTAPAKGKPAAAPVQEVLTKPSAVKQTKRPATGNQLMLLSIMVIVLLNYVLMLAL